jgi:hypothetical protein
MVAFIVILDEVETRTASANQPFAPPQLGLTEVCCAPATNATAIAKVETAYRRFRREPRPTPEPQRAPPRNDDPEQFARLLSGAGYSPSQLKALRRRLAWRLHPDRGPTGDAAPTLSLSDVNAAIDAALDNSHGERQPPRP